MTTPTATITDLDLGCQCICADMDGWDIQQVRGPFHDNHEYGGERCPLWARTEPLGHYEVGLPFAEAVEARRRDALR